MLEQEEGDEMGKTKSLEKKNYQVKIAEYTVLRQLERYLITLDLLQA